MPDVENWPCLKNLSVFTPQDKLRFTIFNIIHKGLTIKKLCTVITFDIGTLHSRLIFCCCFFFKGRNINFKIRRARTPSPLLYSVLRDYNQITQNYIPKIILWTYFLVSRILYRGFLLWILRLHSPMEFSIRGPFRLTQEV